MSIFSNLFRKNLSTTALMRERSKAQEVRINAMSHDEKLAYFYRVIEDMGYADEISFNEYKEIASEFESNDSADMIEAALDKHKKELTWEKFGELAEALESIKEIVAGFEYKVNEDGYGGVSSIANENGSKDWRVQGMICGKAVDVRLTNREDTGSGCSSPVEFIYDVINPLISKIFQKQFICLEPHDGASHFAIIDNARAESVRQNPYFAEDEYMKHFYGYRKTIYPFE